MDSYEHKYLKYKNKYTALRNLMDEMNGGGDTIFVDEMNAKSKFKIVNTAADVINNNIKSGEALLNTKKAHSEAAKKQNGLSQAENDKLFGIQGLEITLQYANTHKSDFSSGRTMYVPTILFDGLMQVFNTNLQPIIS